MSTQEERRRAIGRRLTEERQAIGRRLTEERTGQSIRNDLSRSLPPERTRKTLGAIQARGALPVQVGVGEWRGGGEAAGGGGIASPLSEVEGSRTYHEHPSWVYSNDYLIATEIRPLRSMTMTDANGAPIVFNFALPPEV